RREEGARVEGRRGGQRRDAVGDHQPDADHQEPDGDVGEPDQQAPAQTLGGVGPGRAIRGAHCSPRSSIWLAVYSRTTTNRSRRYRTWTRWASRDPAVAPRKTPMAVGPA